MLLPSTPTSEDSTAVVLSHLLKKAPSSHYGGAGAAVNLALVAVAFSDQVRSHWVTWQTTPTILAIILV